MSMNGINFMLYLTFNIVSIETRYQQVIESISMNTK